MRKVKDKKTAAQRRKERQRKINHMITVYVDVLKKHGEVKVSDMEDYNCSYDQVRYYFGNMEGLEKEARKARPNDFFRVEKKKKEASQKEEDKSKRQEDRKEKIDSILQAYVQVVESKGYASMSDMVDAGFTKDTIVYYFDSLSNLNTVAREKYPDSFFDMDLMDAINDEDNRLKLFEALDKKRRFIVTTAVTGCKANYAAIESMNKYCEENDAHVLVLIASDPAHNVFAPEADYGTIDEALVKSDYFSIVPFDIRLNSNIGISTVKLSAKQIDPVTSMKRIASKDGTFIFASPKQRMAPIAVSNKDFPHFVMTTGAITTPDYTSTNYMSDRTAFIAGHDHIMGGLIVELEDEKWYHFRQFQISEDDSFIDLGYRYKSDGSIEEESAEAFVLGDWHAGYTDPSAKKAWLEVCEYVGVNKLIMHDMFDGMTINHHERKNVVSRAKAAIAKKHNLATEVQLFTKDINELCEYTDEVILVKSNHDEFLDRYLASGYYVNDPENHRYALDLAAAMMDGQDPLRFAAEKIGLKYKDAVRWLDRDEDFKVAGIQLGAHGDLGPNGSRGSVRSMEAAYSQSVTGHAHSPEILRGAWQVGTSSLLKLNYNRGPSSWLHSSCLVYKDGSRQLINSLNGKWRLEE